MKGNEISKYPVPNSVADVAKVFDQEKPGWEKKINLSRLDMMNVVACPMGQVWGRFDGGKLCDWFGETTNFLANPSYHDDWVREIRIRLNKEVILTFSEAFERLLDGYKICGKGWDREAYLHLHDGQICLTNIMPNVNINGIKLKYYRDNYKEWTVYRPSVYLSDIKAGEKFTIPNSTIVLTKLNGCFLAIDDKFNLKDFSANLEVLRYTQQKESA